MANSIPAKITPSILIWARNLDNISVETAAQYMKVAPDKLIAWENGDKQPTLNQAKKLAKYYRIPFAYLFLPDAPNKAKRVKATDYRTIRNIGIPDCSRELRWLLRDIEERRDVIIELYADSEKVAKKFDPSFTIGSNLNEIASAIRIFLDLDYEKQRQFRKPEKALSYCIAKLEEKDFLVFQAAKISTDEMRGLSVVYDVFPIIVLNRKDEYSARLFTLFHELAHIFTMTSAICNDMSHNARDIELLCNKIAGLALAPTDALEQNKRISDIKLYGVEDTKVYAISRDFAVSREVIINRLWNMSVIDDATFFETLKRYSDEYINFAKSKKADGFITPPIDKGTQVGKLYTKTVLNSLYSDKISTREASSYLLGLHMQHFGAIERWCY